MALTQAQRDAIYEAIDIAALDEYASNETSIIEQMTPDEIKQGLNCGTLKLESLNFLILRGLLATQKAEAESKAYTDAIAENAKYKCSWNSQREGNLITLDLQPDGSCLPYYGVLARESDYWVANEGDDDGAGTEANPFKTVKKAFDLIPKTSTNVTIHLKEMQTHIFDLRASEVPAKVKFVTYGEIDNIELAWNTGATGWYSASATAAHTRQARIKQEAFLLPDGTTSGVQFVGKGEVEFQGLTILKPDVNFTNQASYWRSWAIGDVQMFAIECEIDNDAAKIPLATASLSGSPKVKLASCKVLSTNPSTDFLVDSFEGIITMVVTEHGRNGQVHPSGYTWSTPTPVLTMYTLRAGNLPPQTISPNSINPLGI